MENSKETGTLHISLLKVGSDINEIHVPKNKNGERRMGKIIRIRPKLPRVVSLAPKFLPLDPWFLHLGGSNLKGTHKPHITHRPLSITPTSFCSSGCRYQLYVVGSIVKPFATPNVHLTFLIACSATAVLAQGSPRFSTVEA